MAAEVKLAGISPSVTIDQRTANISELIFEESLYRFYGWKFERSFDGFMVHWTFNVMGRSFPYEGYFQKPSVLGNASNPGITASGPACSVLWFASTEKKGK